MQELTIYELQMVLIRANNRLLYTNDKASLAHLKLQTTLS